MTFRKSFGGRVNVTVHQNGNTYFSYTVYHTDIIHLLILYLLKAVQMSIVSAALLAKEVQAVCRIQYTNMNIHLVTEP